MKFTFPIIFSLLIPCLTSCAIGTHGMEVSGVDDKTPDRFYMSDKWVVENHEEIVKQIYDLIKTKHPDTADDFPNIVISRLTPLDGTGYEEIKNILNDVASRFSQESNSEEDWLLDIWTAAYRPTFNTLEIGAGVTYGAMCWSSFLAICPVRDTTYVKLQINVTNTRTNTSKTIYGYGGGARYISTPWKDDGPPESTLIYERNSKALVAAIASAVDQLVLLYEGASLPVGSN